MISCGLLGKKLRHSYSPQIHAMLGDYEYRLYEKTEEELPELLSGGSWTGLNVTIPYKKAVIPYLSSMSETVRRTGSANTLVRRENGEIYGDNTDVYGFIKMTEHSGISVKDRKVLVLGSGGASASVIAALTDLGAHPTIISRSGENHYGNLDLHRDAQIIVNTTPVGMYPETGISPVDPGRFPELKGVFDLIYNPARTALLLEAEKLGIPYENGLYMLAAQAKRSAELFTGSAIPDDIIDRIYHQLKRSLLNIVLIGMPGSGKSSVAQKLHELTGRRTADSDEEITKRTRLTPAQLITEKGEPAFRETEHSVLKELGKESGIILSTGGGAVVTGKNYDVLHQNGTIVWLRRDLAALPDTDRPISKSTGIEELYRQREPLYRKFADIEAVNDKDLDKAASDILNAISGGSNS